jgi:hypothetical protein
MANCTVVPSSCSVGYPSLLRDHRVFHQVCAGLEGLIKIGTSLESTTSSWDVRRAQFADVLQEIDQLKELLHRLQVGDQTALRTRFDLVRVSLRNRLYELLDAERTETDSTERTRLERESKEVYDIYIQARAIEVRLSV